MRTVLILGTVLLASAVVAGCGGSPSSVARRPEATSASPTRLPVPGTALRASGVGETGTICTERVTGLTDTGYYAMTLTAATPLHVTGVRAGEGHGVTVVGGYAVPLRGRAPEQIGVTDWPPPKPSGPGVSVDWSKRTALVGAHLTAQQAVLPLWHFRVRPGGHLEQIQVAYLTDADQVGYLDVPVHLSFDRRDCSTTPAG